MNRPFYNAIVALLAAVSLASCSSIDCPLNNTVLTNVRLAGGEHVLSDTLSVYAMRHNGSDTLLINRSIGVDSLLVPMSYGGEKDVWRLEWRTTALTTFIDTLTISKTNEPHFESVDCSPAFFHTITSASVTGNAADSVVVKRSHVDYNTSSTHLTLYVHTHE